MRANRVARMLVFVLIVLIIVGAGFATAVLHLWNWLMPATFGLHPITYWQALGLLGLSWLLFGGPRTWFGGGRRHYWQHRMRARWESMTPEERERFRHGMSHRCGHAKTRSTESKA